MFVRRSRIKPQINLNCQRRRDVQPPSSPTKKPDTRSVTNAKTTNAAAPVTNVIENKTSKPENNKEKSPVKVTNGETLKEVPVVKIINVKHDTPKLEAVATFGLENVNIAESEKAVGKVCDKKESSEKITKETVDKSHLEKSKDSQGDIDKDAGLFKIPAPLPGKSVKANNAHNLGNDVIQNDLKISTKTSNNTSISKCLNNGLEQAPNENEKAKDKDEVDGCNKLAKSPETATPDTSPEVRKRLRTESSSSIAPDCNGHIGPKMRKMNEQRRLQRAETKKHIAAGVTDKTNLKMFDLIYYNPPGSPMKSIPITRRPVVRDESSSDEESDIKEEPPTVVAPQLKLGDNGEMIVDIDSLQIETTIDPEAQKSLANSSALVLDEDTGMNGFYSRKPRTKEWAEDETLKFYRCLQVIGTDFFCMSQLFPNRSRRDLKLKFKKEERVNGGLVNKAIMNPKEFNIDRLKDQLTESETLLKQYKSQTKKLKEDGKATKKHHKDGSMQFLEKGHKTYHKRERNKRPRTKKTDDNNQAAKEDIIKSQNINENINDNKKTIDEEKEKEKENETARILENAISSLENALENPEGICSILENSIINSEINDPIINSVIENAEQIQIKIEKNTDVATNHTEVSIPIGKCKKENNGYNNNGYRWSRRRRRVRCKKEPQEPKEESAEQQILNVLSTDNLKVEQIDENIVQHRTERRGERTVSGESFSLDQIENELMTLMTSDDTLLDQVDFDSLSDAEKALLSNPNTPRKDYKDFINKNLNNNYNYTNHDTKVTLPSINSIMETLNHNKITQTKTQNDKSDAKRNLNFDQVTTSSPRHSLENSPFPISENGGLHLGASSPNVPASKPNENPPVSSSDSPCHSSPIEPRITNFKVEQIQQEDSMDGYEQDVLNKFIHKGENPDEECEIDLNEIQTILEKISDGSMALVSTLDPNNCDQVINEIFLVNKDTGELSDKPLSLPEELVQSILEVIS